MEQIPDRTTKSVISINRSRTSELFSILFEFMCSGDMCSQILSHLFSTCTNFSHDFSWFLLKHNLKYKKSKKNKNSSRLEKKYKIIWTSNEWMEWWQSVGLVDGQLKEYERLPSSSIQSSTNLRCLLVFMVPDQYSCQSIIEMKIDSLFFLFQFWDFATTEISSGRIWLKYS